MEDYRRKYPAAGLPNQPAAATYDAIYLLRDVIARSGTRRAAIRRGMAAVGGPRPLSRASPAPSSSIRSATCPASEVHIGVVRGGEIRLAEGG